MPQNPIVTHVDRRRVRGGLAATIQLAKAEMVGACLECHASGSLL